MADPFSLFLSQSFSPPYHVEERESRGKEAEQPCRAARRAEQRDDHHQPRSALACHVLLDADAKHTQYHTGPPSPTSTSSPSPHHSISLPSLPHDATPQRRSAPPCSRASTHAMAAMGRWCGGWGEREQQKRKEEETQYLTYSHMYHLLLVCACVACRWRRT